MTIMYLLGVLQTFSANKAWTFRATGNHKIQLGKYVSAYLLGYLINLYGLFLLVDKFQIPHQWAQGGMIVVVAAVLFVIQKAWVFR